MDKIGADLDYSVNSIREKLQASVAQVHVPIGKESEFHGIYDVI